MRHLHLDFETRSDIDLRKTGVHVYAEGKNTDVWCAAYAFDDGPVQFWLPGDKLPNDVRLHIVENQEVWAHNAAFEYAIHNAIMADKYGWPLLTVDQLVCTQAMAYAMALPGSLAGASAALGVEQQKDMTGARLMMQMCQPRTVNADGSITWWDEPDKIERLVQYCVQDVEVERAIGLRMMRLSDKEQAIYRLDQNINNRGIAVDVEAAKAALILVENEKMRLNEEIRRVSGNQVASCQAVAQIKEFLKGLGVPVGDSMAKGDVVDLLALKTLPAAAERVLTLRQEAGKASTAKLKSMVEGSGLDGRMRGMFQYSGANTRRWAGRRTQLQNLPRPKLKPQVVDEILTRLKQGSVTSGYLDLMYGSPIDVISSCLRGFLWAAPGCDLVACDFSAIEARVIAWVAGQETALEIFRTHGKIYEHAAAGIFGLPMDKVTDAERQVGKVAVLALGYQGGVGAFQTMARGYGVQMAPAYRTLFEIMASTSDRDWVQHRYNTELKNYPDISREEFIASDLTKVFWRRANPEIVDLWGRLEDHAIEAVNNPGHTFEVNGLIKYKVAGSFLWCRLPSGGVICYPYPEVKTVKMPWGAEKKSLTYMSEDGQSHKWLRFKTYGGSLAENVTQAIARDLLAESMLRLQSFGFDIVAHVHDEVIAEVRAGNPSVERMALIMEQVPLWANGLPLKAAGWQGKRFRK